LSFALPDGEAPALAPNCGANSPLALPPPPDAVALIGAGCQLSISQWRCLSAPTWWRPTMKTIGCWWVRLGGKSATVNPTPFVSEYWSFHLACAAVQGAMSGSGCVSHCLRVYPARIAGVTSHHARSTLCPATAEST